ncbi:ADP-ribosylglycohydrolase family protein [Acidaminococcus timonensis]|uniref:ADP-ribosylglycohydrolase family protein n=1 Tax=Acidaminococcus timonensis TaxID=1871002 RepID=UPI0008D96D87|nr:ADP-ribosylglycohydrolase family protein [Acidaminococcus timonensis]
MEGAFIGDIVGSKYEWRNYRHKAFPLFSQGCRATDDSLMTLAVARAFAAAKAQGKLLERHTVLPLLAREMRALGQKYPDAGFGGKFRYWLFHPEMGAYGSFGNGAAMRVSPAGWYGRTLAEARQLAILTCEVSHNHPESYRAAQAVAGAIFLARQKKSKEEIREYLKPFYDLSFTVEGIRDTYQGDATCQNSVPQALVSFLDSSSFEDALRNAVSLGGDSDTLAAIAGSIAEPFYGIPEEILEEGRKFYLPEMKNAVDKE